MKTGYYREIEKNTYNELKDWILWEVELEEAMIEVAGPPGPYMKDRLIIGRKVGVVASLSGRTFEVPGPRVFFRPHEIANNKDRAIEIYREGIKGSLELNKEEVEGLNARIEGCEEEIAEMKEEIGRYSKENELLSKAGVK